MFFYFYGILELKMCHMKRILAILAIISVSLFSINGVQALSLQSANHFGAVDTVILTDCGSRDGGEGVLCIINLVLDIMTAGVGVLGVVAISIVGIQYLTAGDNEEKVRTAKRRIFEIAIGLAAYAVISSAAYFLLPDSKVTTGGSSSSGSSIKVVDSTGKSTVKSSGTKTETKTKEAAKTTKKKTKEETAIEKLKTTVKKYAWTDRAKDCAKDSKECETRNKHAKEQKANYARYSGYKSSGGARDCGVFVSAMMHISGWDEDYSGHSTAEQYNYLKNSKKWKNITNDIREGKTDWKPGDIIISEGKGHVWMYAGLKGDGFESNFVEASYHRFTGRAARTYRSNLSKFLDTGECTYINCSNGHHFAVFRKTV